MVGPRLSSAAAAHYFAPGYVSPARFISYSYQLALILKLAPTRVLEIGIGPGVVAGYLRNAGLHVVTCDVEPGLRPDCVGDACRLPFKDAQFDVVAAFEVLEHMPLEEAELALSEMRRVSRSDVLISLPHSFAYLEARFRIGLGPLNKALDMAARVPYFFRAFRPPDEAHALGSRLDHCWEMGRKGVSRTRVRAMLRRYFRIREEFQPPEHSRHYFFVLENAR